MHSLGNGCIRRLHVDLRSKLLGRLLQLRNYGWRLWILLLLDRPEQERQLQLGMHATVLLTGQTIEHWETWARHDLAQKADKMLHASRQSLRKRQES